jgi:DNA polymerase-4
MERRIVHMDLDSFFVSVERKLDSSLNGKPVIIGGTSDRGVVSSCSYEARLSGVHSAMPIKMAKQLCPHAIYIRGDMDNYAKYSNIVTEIIEEKAPLVEKASIDEHYIDISGIDKYIKNSLLWTKELRERIIKESGLPISFGLSVNKTVSKVATGTAKPNGEKCVDSGIEKLFLAPLSIKKIPGVGNKTYMSLRNMGIEKIETLQQMPVIMLQKAFGESGKVIWNKANGIDDSPVEPYSEQKSMSRETTFQKDTTDVNQLKNVLITMVEELGFELRKSNKVAGCVVLKLRFSDFQTHVFQAAIPYTASDHVILQKLMELFDKHFTRRVLIRLIGVKLSKLVNGQTQIDLFDDTEEMINLYQSLDKIRLRFGDKAVMRSIGLLENKPKIVKKK